MTSENPSDGAPASATVIEVPNEAWSGDQSTGKTPDHIQNVSDDSLAVKFADKHYSDLQYVGQWNYWMSWNGIKWERDHMLRVFRSARVYIRTIANDIAKKITKTYLSEIPPLASDDKKSELRRNAKTEGRRAVRGLLSARTISAVTILTRSDQRIAASVDQWDRDPYLLSTPEGTMDLHTGALRQHNPRDYITQVTAVAPRHGEPKMWLSFLRTIMRDQEEMIHYLQKIFGYCLVGETKEHQMYFAYGTGGNGKGVTINTMRCIFGDYGKEANIETFVVTQSDRHPTELADLRGLRLVTCGETEEGQRWAEARIKKMTGGDPIKARFMRQDYFQYQPQFKLVLGGNHKPRLANVDEAIKRRFRLLPFTYTVPEEKRDLDLFEKLQPEWPQILQWAIDGCMMWQSEGLSAPDTVRDATRSYLSQEDAVTAWYNECCLHEPDGFEYIKDLYESWHKWALDNGESSGTKRVLTTHLEDREPTLNIRKSRRELGLGFHGVELRTPPKNT